MGMIFTEEHRANIGRANKGRIVSEKTRAKMSHSSKARQQTLEYRTERSEESRVRWQNPEYRARMNQILRIRWQSPEFRATMHQSQMGKTLSKETRAKMSQSRVGIIFTEETRARMSQVAKINMSKNWQDIEFKDRRVKAIRLGCCVHPNKSETLLFELLESVYPREWEFVGDGQLIINGLAPTFISLRMIFFLVFRAAQDSNEAT